MSVTSFRSDQLMWIASAIHHHGIAVIAVGSGACTMPGCRCKPDPITWSYTIGFAECGLPEIVTTGLSLDDAMSVSNWCWAERVAGRTFTAGDELVHCGVRARIDTVPRSWVHSDDDPLGQWFAHYSIGRASIRPPELLQFVWADRRGRLPGDAGCDPAVTAAQPCGPRLARPDWARGPSSPALRKAVLRLRQLQRFR